MKLYKFRPLGDDLSFCRAKEILRTGQFWCSRFWELNDPMEGVYSFPAADKVRIEDLFSNKARRVICSFSGPEAFSNPVIWGYYANGFKGMAIEIEMSADEVQKIKKMTYAKDVAEWSKTDGANRVTKILTTKLSRWKHEDEYRYLCNSVEPVEKRIGRITTVHFGDPYGMTVNRCQIIEKSTELRAFLAYRSELQSLAKSKDIACSFVTVSVGKVTANCPTNADERYSSG
ncbi:hypothetical protein RAS1_37040 [Phycisphaerae bacterium RAS1]|nr:hypothetical protein RAS1_37040 [Phycisphaerae bacterium RAS1]